MPKKTLLIRKRQDDKPQFIQLILKDNILTREHGIVGGIVHGSEHTYTGINIGKSNEKTPTEVAKEAAERIINDKKKEGYIATDSLDNLSELETDKTFSLSSIPEAFCISKPTQTVTLAKIDKLLEAGNGEFLIKYNGIGHYLLHDPSGNVKVFTRRWCDHTKKYPEIVKEFEKQNYPKGTLIYSEFVIDPTLGIPHMTAFLLMSGISKADTVKGQCKEKVPKSLALQEEHRVRAALLYIVYLDNLPVYNYDLKIVRNSLIVKTADSAKGEALFIPTALPIESGRAAFKLVKDNKDSIEGLVLIDTSAHIEVTMNGKPNRCATWKIKIRGDTDVIAYGYKEGKGKFQGKVGSLKICQNDENEVMVDLGSVGGLTEPDRDPNTWEFPCVIEVKYDQRFPDTGLFQFGRFSKRHEDKLPDDVNIFYKGV